MGCDQTFLDGLRREDGIDHDHVVRTRICAQFGQHLLFGVEIFMNDGGWSLPRRLLERPADIGAVALPVQDADLVGEGMAGGQRDECGGKKAHLIGLLPFDG
ncbi:MAG: hypothetical protein R3C97_06255 [Geminicoccaceae bacterium]